MTQLILTPPTQAPTEPPGTQPPSRHRLDHVDAMRPIKQLGVVSTHCLTAFAPGSLAVGAALMLLHVSREGFLFIAACMLTYRYYTMAWSDLGRFWRRRLAAVGLPYLCWTLIYWLIGLHEYASTGAAAWNLAELVFTGYYQLYFLVVLLQFYALFPLVLWLLRRTERHHVALVATSFALQVAYMTLIHWKWIPAWMPEHALTREVFSYQLYLLAGCVAAAHYRAVHAWLTSHVRIVVTTAFVTAAVAETCYWLAARHVLTWLGSSSDPFQPTVIPFNLAAIAVIYLIGVALVRPRTPATVRRLTRIGTDNSYSVYLSQMVFVDALGALGWRGLDKVMPWPLAVAGAVAVVFVSGCALGGLLGRTRAAWPLVGRHQVPGPRCDRRSWVGAAVGLTEPKFLKTESS